MRKEKDDGTKLYCHNGKPHRLDGPAVEKPKDTQAYRTMDRKLQSRPNKSAQRKSSGIYFYYLGGHALTFDAWLGVVEKICGGSHAMKMKLKWSGG